MKGLTYLNVKLYDDEDNCQEYLVGVEWEVVSSAITEEKGWYTDIVDFPEGISEETKEKLRTEVHYMYEDIVYQDDSDEEDYGERYD
jgi:hypothetical protein